MSYKVQILNGFKLYFDQITIVFRSRYLMDNNITIDELTARTCLNRRKTRLLLNYLADLGLNEKRTLKKTELGEIIFNYDDFLEDDGTLWLIHYLSSFNEYLIIWNRFFNYISDKTTITIDEILSLYKSLKGEISEYSYEHHIRKEVVSILLDAYTERRLYKLDLITRSEDDSEKYFVNKQHSVPEVIFLATCIKFRDEFYKGATAIEISDLCYKENSPGRLFLLNENKVRSLLDKLRNKRLIGIESRGDLDQIRFSNDINFEDIIKKYYEKR